jgi:hypothetical protein
MNASIRTLLVPLLAAASFATGTAQASPKPFSPLDAGMPVADAAGERSIDVSTDRHYINVVNGETVTFVVGGKRFTYAFNAWNTIGAIDLSSIAPKDLRVPQVRIYIAPNPASQG